MSMVLSSEVNMLGFAIASTLPVFFGFANRFRGGLWPTGHTELTRFLFAVWWAVGLAYFLHLQALWVVPAIGFMTVIGHARFMGLARWWQYPMLALTGVGNMFLLAVLFWYLGLNWWIILLAGASKTPMYYLGDKILQPRISNYDDTKWWNSYGSGEFWFGVSCGIGAAITVTL